MIICIYILNSNGYNRRAGKRRCADTHTPSPTHTQEHTRSQTARWSSARSTWPFHEAEAVSRVYREIEEKGSGRKPAAFRPQKPRSPFRPLPLSFYSSRRGGCYNSSYHHYSLSSRTEIHQDLPSNKCATQKTHNYYVQLLKSCAHV